jgi:cyclopropane fatty-acyl-phospholipid synthase-like methyltransferase
MNEAAQKNYFEIAYRTGSDVWTHIPYHMIAMKMLPALEKDAMVLDVGAGRGLWISKLVADGNRAIGLENIADVVKKGNQDIKLHGFEDRARFVYGDVRDIPLVDQSFDAVTDIGVLQHLASSDWDTYASEIRRVLKPGGLMLNVSLSKETSRFLGFQPKRSEQSEFEKFGVYYHFFTNAEVNNLFTNHGFMIMDQKVHTFETKTDPGDAVTLLFSLYKKM